MKIRPSKQVEAYSWFQGRHRLDLSPPYQRRGGLWSPQAKAFLIDSMINGFDVPKIYVAELALLPANLRTPNMARAVIDGRQRFEAMFEWFMGELPLNDDFILTEDPEVRAAGYNSRELAARYPELAGRVENFSLSVMEVWTDSQDEINQLFIRLNQSQPLTGAETRNAMAGEAPQVLRRLVQHQFFEDRIRFNVKRGGDLNTAAKLLLVEFVGSLVDVKKRRLDSFVKEIAKEGELAEAPVEALRLAEDAVERVLDAMSLVFQSRDPLLNTQGQTPVYYWLVRNVGADPNLRDFLDHFEWERQANRRLVAERGTTGDVDVELLQYDQFNRSVNDQHSLRGRYEILMTRWKRWRSLQPRLS